MLENLNTANPWLAREHGFFGSVTVFRTGQKLANFGSLSNEKIHIKCELN